MNSSVVTDKANIITKIIFVVLLVVVLLLAVVFSFSAFQTVNTSQGNTNTVTVVNESGWINGSGDFLNAPGIVNPAGFSIIAVINATANGGAPNNTLVNTANYTLVTATGFYNSSNAGAGQVWPNVSVTYSYTYNSQTQNNYTATTNTISGSLINMVVNFVALLPITGTILAVSILIGIIVLLVVYVKTMARSGNSDSNFQG